MPANLATAQRAAADFGRLCACVVERMAHHNVPGVAVGVLRDGEEHTAGFGITNVEAPVPVNADTLFQIGSITKTVTGTAALRLVEAGKLDLDAPLRTYLPDMRLADEVAAARVTLRHLLNHTAGWIGDRFEDTGLGDDALARFVATLADLPQLMPPGAAYSYNNAGFSLAGRVIEAATGQPYEASIRDLVFDPLGMATACFFATDAITRRVAVGHGVRDGVPVVARPWALHRSVHPAFGVASSLADLLRYARFHLGDGAAPDGTRLLSPATLAAMQSPTTPAGSGAGMVGLAWMSKAIGGVKAVYHSGETNAQNATLLLIPQHHFALAVLTNGSRGGALHEEVAKWALAHYFGIAEAEPEPLPLGEAALAEYAGYYRATLFHYDLAVRDGALWLQALPQGGFPDRYTKPSGPPPPPTRLAICADNHLVALDPPFQGSRGEFLRAPDGAIAWLRISGRTAKRE